jgi:hypothetical protein
MADSARRGCTTGATSNAIEIAHQQETTQVSGIWPRLKTSESSKNAWNWNRKALSARKNSRSTHGFGFPGTLRLRDYRRRALLAAL